MLVADRLAADVEAARRWADFYRARGYNPLPSRPDAKRPMVRFAEFWERPFPASQWRPTSNVQVMTGRAWRLLVLDLDGPAAADWLAGLGRRLPRTWATTSGGQGRHLWFTLPEGLGPLPKAVLWQGDGKHSAVERLCDRSLIVAPPSVHPATGRRYRFASKAESPAGLPMPAPCPAWVLDLEPVAPPKAEAPAPPRASRRVVARDGRRYRAADVLDAIPDKLALAEEWGVRVASRRPNVAGWCPCHAIGRDDRNPSASISPATGRYWEPGGKSVSLFELAALRGVYADWREAVADLARRFGAKEATR